MDSSQRPPLPIGARIDTFEITRVLPATGAAGHSYLGTDTTTKKPVEIREYPPEVAQGLAPLAKIKHPGVMSPLCGVKAGGLVYLVSEALAGEPLSAIIRREKTFDEGRLKGILLPLADGLELAHEAGVLHLAISPEHIIVRANGSPVLVGFGGAAASPAYRALEQQPGELRIGRWTDIYSLGAVAYRLISGHAPPDAASRAQNETLRSARETGANTYSRSLLLAIDWALKTHPLERPQNLTQWKDALLGLRETVGIGAASGATMPITATMIRKFTEARENKGSPAPAATPASKAATPIPPQWLEPPKPVPPSVPAAARPPPPPPPSPALAPRAPAVTPPPVTQQRPPERPRSAARRTHTGAITAGALAIGACVLAFFLWPSGDPPAPAARRSAIPPSPSPVPAAPQAAPPASVSEARKEVPVAPPQAPASEPRVSPPQEPPADPPKPVSSPKAPARPARPTAYMQMQKQLSAVLWPKLKGQWTLSSSVPARLRDGTCPVTVNRSWTVMFTGATADGQSIDGNFKTSFEAQGGGGCSFRRENSASGDFTSQPASPAAIRLSAENADCSGDCADAAEMFDYFLPDRTYRLSISEQGDLELQEGDERFVLKRTRKSPQNR